VATTEGTGTITSTLVRRPRLTLPRRESLLLLPPAALLLAWLGLLLGSFGAIVGVIYSNADIVSAPAIGELFPKEASGATTVLGFLPWYSTLWFELATRWLPFHRQLWEVAPWVASLAGIALVAWGTTKAAGRWAGWCVFFVLVCAGNRLLPVQFASDLHGATAVYACVLDAFLVLLVLRAGRIGGAVSHALVCTVVAAVAAAGVASDQLLIPTGLVPFVAAGAAQLWSAPRPIGRRIATSAVAVGVGAAVGAGIAVLTMHSVHVYAAEDRVTFARWVDLGRNTAWLFQAIAAIFNGDFSGAEITARSLLAFACAAVVLCAVVASVRLGRSQYVRLRAGERSLTPVRDAQVTFWAATALLTALAFVFSSFAGSDGSRYLVTVGYAVVVLATIAVARRGDTARAVATFAACVVIAGSVVALAARDLAANGGHYPTADFARFLSTFADGENLKYGYASYWVGPALTWRTSAHLEVYPVLPCSSSTGLCTYPVHAISSWYVPRRDTRTFLIIDSRYGPNPNKVHLGGSDEVVSYGEYKIYVYSYDIAVNLGDWHLYPEDAS
jgi:hypothetical protein